MVLEQDKIRYISGQMTHTMKRQVKKAGSEAKSVVAEAAAGYGAVSLAAEDLLSIDGAMLDEPLDRVNTFRKGFRRKSFDHLKEATGLDYQTLAFALSVSTKTLQRSKAFDVVQSEKLYGLAGLYALGMSYFGKEGFERWMERPLFSLGNRRPIELLDVQEGIALLRGEIMKLQHGVAV